MFGNEKHKDISSSLSLKVFQNDTIDIEDSVGVQNRQAACLPVAASGLLSRVASGEEPNNSRSVSSGPKADNKVGAIYQTSSRSRFSEEFSYSRTVRRNLLAL